MTANRTTTITAVNAAHQTHYLQPDSGLVRATSTKVLHLQKTAADRLQSSVRIRRLGLSIHHRQAQQHQAQKQEHEGHDPRIPMLTHADCDANPTPAACHSITSTDASSTSARAVAPTPLNPNTPGPAHPPSIYEKQRQRHVEASTPNQQTPAVRKPSPGLAARLKALGFGTSASEKSPELSPASRDPIGRLDEQQLRQLDEKHQAGSLSSIISRRGRPWKGATATAPQLAVGEPESQAILTLPEIITSEPLMMESQEDSQAIDDARPPTPPPKSPPPAPPQTPPPESPAAPSTPLREAPPAATATTPSTEFPGLGAYFTPGQNRPGSIYTLSRASFANQLAQLTSLQLPDAESLSSHVSAMPTAQVASKALINAAEQIRSWITKATDVIGGLDSEDDVEWSAAGGREGLAEVETAINRFEELIHVYVGAIEELQGRPDIADVSGEDLKRAVSQMENILDEWNKIRVTLNAVRGQVEIAMEWEELWNNVLGDIQGEMDELGRLVFEMEERRHKGETSGATGENVDIGDLETIVEDTPPQRLQVRSNRLSMPGFPMSPTSPGTPTLSADDSSLLALFARMQPLRASLDFLPMRLSVFEARADKSFPTACEELEMRRVGLDGSYKKLEKDAEILRKELGEDRWVIVFRGAGRQALKMHESVERSLLKAREAVDAGLHLANPPAMMKKIESYEAKKTHYGPAIERVLSIIDNGVKDRLTVNGEVLRLHADMERKWTSLKEQMSETDAILNEVLTNTKGPMRDSVSSMVSNAPSTAGSGQDTPGSSPPSSVIMTSLGFDPKTPVPKSAKARSASNNSSVASRRISSLPAPSSQVGKRLMGSRLSTITGSSATSPVGASRLQRPASNLPQRPRWNSSTVHPDTGHNFKPLSSTTPSPYAKNTTPTTQRSQSALTPSPAGSKLPSYKSRLQRAASESPRTASATNNTLSPADTTPSKRSPSRLASFRERLASPGPYSQQTLSKPRLSSQTSSSSTNSNRRASMQPLRPALSVEQSSTPSTRPASSLASSRRTSNLLAPEGGRTTPLSLSRLGMRKNSTSESDKARPKWRP